MTATIEHLNRFEPPGISYRLQPPGSLRRTLRPRLDPEKAVESDGTVETGLLENESEAEARAREEQAREENRRRQEAAQQAEAAARQHEEARRQAELRANASPTVDEDYQRYLEYGAGGLDNPYHPDNLGTVHTVDGRVVESSTSKDGQVRYTFADGSRETFQRDDSGNVVGADGSAPLRESFSGSRRLVPDFSSVADPTEPDATETRADLDRSFMEDGLSRTNTVEDSASGLLDGTRMTSSEETPPDNVSQETPAEVVSTTPTAFTGRVNVIADGDSDPVEFANQQVDEANAAAAEAEAAHEEAQLAYVPGWAYYGSSREELLKDLTPQERAHEYIRGEDATAGFTIDFDPEQGEGQPAHYSTTGNRADFFRQHFEAEVGRVNDAAAPLAEATKKIEELQASGQKVYTDSPEWREYLSAKSGFDDAVELAHTRLQLGRNSGETRYDALERYVSSVAQKQTDAGHPDAYAKWQKEYAEAETALKAAEGWRQPLAATGQPSAEGVGSTMSEGSAPATHRLVETPEGLPSLVVPINREAQPATGVGHSMSEGPYFAPENPQEAEFRDALGDYTDAGTKTTYVREEPTPPTGSQRPNAALMANFYGHLGNFSEQYQSLRESLESNEPGGRHFGLDEVIERARGFEGPLPAVPAGGAGLTDVATPPGATPKLGLSRPPFDGDGALVNPESVGGRSVPSLSESDRQRITEQLRGSGVSYEQFSSLMDQLHTPDPEQRDGVFYDRDTGRLAASYNSYLERREARDRLQKLGVLPDEGIIARWGGAVSQGTAQPPQDVKIEGEAEPLNLQTSGGLTADELGGGSARTPAGASGADDYAQVDMSTSPGLSSNVDAVLDSTTGAPRVHVGGAAPDVVDLGGLPRSDGTAEPTPTLRLDDGSSERGEIGGLRSFSGQTVAINSLELGGHVTPREPELAQTVLRHPENVGLMGDVGDPKGPREGVDPSLWNRIASHNQGVVARHDSAQEQEAMDRGYGGDLQAEGNERALTALRNITADNYYDTLRSVQQTVYLDGQKVDLERQFPEIADTPTGARLRRDLEGSGIVEEQAAKIAKSAQEGTLTLEDTSGPERVYIRRPDATAEGTHVQRFERDVQKAMDDGKVVVVQEPRSELQQIRDAAEWVVPGFGALNLYETRRRSLQGSGFVTQQERGPIALGIVDAAADVADIGAIGAAAGGSGKLILRGGRAALTPLGGRLVDVGGNVISYTKGVVGPPGVAKAMSELPPGFASWDEYADAAHKAAREGTGSWDEFAAADRMADTEWRISQRLPVREDDQFVEPVRAPETPSVSERPSSQVMEREPVDTSFDWQTGFRVGPEDGDPLANVQLRSDPLEDVRFSGQEGTAAEEGVSFDWSSGFQGQADPAAVAARHERDRQRLTAALAARESRIASADVSYKQNLAKAEARSPAELAELLNTPYQRLSAPDQLAVTVANTKARQAGMSGQEYVQKLAAETTQPVVGPAGQAATAPMVQTSTGLALPASAISVADYSTAAVLNPAFYTGTESQTQAEMAQQTDTATVGQVEAAQRLQTAAQTATQIEIAPGLRTVVQPEVVPSLHTDIQTEIADQPEVVPGPRTGTSELLWTRLSRGEPWEIDSSLRTEPLPGTPELPWTRRRTGTPWDLDIPSRGPSGQPWDLDVPSPEFGTQTFPDFETLRLDKLREAPAPFGATGLGGAPDATPDTRAYTPTDIDIPQPGDIPPDDPFLPSKTTVRRTQETQEARRPLNRRVEHPTPNDARPVEGNQPLREDEFPRQVAHEEVVLDVDRGDGSVDRVLVDVGDPKVTAADPTPPPAGEHIAGNQRITASGQNVHGETVNPVLPARDAAEQHPEGQVEEAVFVTDLDTSETTVHRYREEREAGESLEDQLERLSEEDRQVAPVANTAEGESRPAKASNLERAQAILAAAGAGAGAAAHTAAQGAGGALERGRALAQAGREHAGTAMDKGRTVAQAGSQHAGAALERGRAIAQAANKYVDEHAPETKAALLERAQQITRKANQGKGGNAQPQSLDKFMAGLIKSQGVPSGAQKNAPKNTKRRSSSRTTEKDLKKVGRGKRKIVVYVD